jgi:hypothetical protein
MITKTIARISFIYFYAIMIYDAFTDFLIFKEVTTYKFILTGILFLSAFYLWGYALAHWSKQVFKNKFFKTFWFVVILAALFYGAQVYYILVSEFKLTLKKG